MDFVTAATHFSGHGRHGVVFTHLAVFQLRDPDFVHAFGFEDADVVFADDVAFGQQFFSAGAEDSAA
jgi:hypothetical protein